jgi:phage recombination protein Bet
MTTSTAVATRDTAVSIRAGQQLFDDKQRAALAVLGVKDATAADLAVYMHVCQRTGLDPFTRQIYMLNRREKQGDQWVTKQTIQVGIDGFRVIRDRAARRDGVDVEYEDTRWYDADGTSYEIWLRDEPPAGCGMTVLKNGKRYPAVLTYREYCQTNRDGKPTGKWRDAPAHQLEKCCEAFGLRRAFPHDLAGIRLDDELPPADTIEPAQQRNAATDVTPRGQRRQASPPPAPAPDEPAEAEIVDEPAPGSEPDTAPAGNARSDRPTGAAIGKLGRLLTRIPVAQHGDQGEWIAWATGRLTARSLDDLTRDETARLTGLLGRVLDEAGGDTAAAAARLWAVYDQDTGRAAEPDSEASDE